MRIGSLCIRHVASSSVPLLTMQDLPLAFLSLPAEGDNTARALRKKVRLVALRELLTVSASALGPRANGAMIKIQAVLQRVARSNSAGLLGVVGLVDIQPQLLVLASGLRTPAQVLPRLVPTLLSALRHIRADLDEALVWEHPFDSMSVDGVGEVHFLSGAKALLVDAGGVAVELSTGDRISLTPFGACVHDVVRVSNPPSVLRGAQLGLELSTNDTNPLAMDEAHPDKDGNNTSLGGKSTDEWTTAIDDALGLVQLALPAWYGELTHTTDRIVPVGFEPEMHLSASYREAPGLVYMTLHPDPLTMAEALIHETQHGKLNLLSWLDPVLNNAYSSWTESPVRPDLRPIMGVLLAVHAFVPVSALHHRLLAMEHPISRTPHFEKRRQQVLSGNAGGLKLVESVGEPTALGARVVGGLRALHDAIAADADATSWAVDAMPPG